MEIEDLFNSEYLPKDDAFVPKKKSPLLSLSNDLKYYATSIKEVSEEIVKEGVSNYPIFLASEDELTFGEMILDNKDFGTRWSIYVTHLDECLERGVIERAKLESFKAAYKNPEEYICLLVVTLEGANFVFFPYKSENK